MERLKARRSSQPRRPFLLEGENKFKSLRSTFETTSSTLARCALQNLQLYTLPSRCDVKIRPIFSRCKPARHAVAWHLLKGTSSAKVPREWLSVRYLRAYPLIHTLNTKVSVKHEQGILIPSYIRSYEGILLLLFTKDYY